jgi:hypothetical protein
MDTKIAPPSYLGISVLSGGRGEKLSGVHERDVAISLSIEVNLYTGRGGFDGSTIILRRYWCDRADVGVAQEPVRAS